MITITRGTMSWVLAGALLAGGCSSEEDEPPAQAGTVNEQASVLTTQSTIGAVTAATSPGANGSTVAGQLGAAAQSTQGIVGPAAGNGQQSLALETLLRPMADPPGGTSGTTGTCDCNETSCTFKGCTVGGILTVDGSYSWGGGRLQATDLKYTVAAAVGGTTANITIALSCDLTVTATSLDGTLRTTGNTTTNYGGSTYSTDWTTNIQFRNVTFPSGGGSPTGGSQRVEGRYTVTNDGQPTAYSGAFDVTFPAGS